MPRPYLIGHIITLLTSFLFLYGGQAHLTAEYTPDLARQIVRMSQGAEKAWWFFGLDAEQIRKYFGIYALITGALLIVPHTSRRAMRMALGFTCLGLYSAWYNGYPLMPQAITAAVQVVGLMTN